MSHRLLAIFIALFLVGITEAVDLVIPTTYGEVQGTLSYADTGRSLRVWRGVPFASPPTGNLRFASPVPPAPWQGTLDCVSNKPICPQLRSVDGIVLGSEDCLYLDIYSPLNATKTSGLPVMVWIYGGGYVFGDNYEFGLYDATNRVDMHNYVHVAMNYRLAALGFLALPGLEAEDQFGSTGNMALQDQQLALQFVKKNIQNFGGDPTKVTIFGESAGAFSVCWHLVSPTSIGLFRAAIMESGNCQSPGFFYPKADAFSFGEEYAKSVGCTNSDPKALVACLRSLTTAEVLAAFNKKRSDPSFNPEDDNTAAPFYPLLYPIMPWGPAIDGTPHGLLDLPYTLLREGKFNKVPTILGTNANEGNIFIPGLPSMVPGADLPLDEARTKIGLQHFFNATTTDTIIGMYYDSGITWESVVAIILRDYFFACTARRVATALYNANVPAFLYHFTFVAPDWIDQWALGDYHSSELEFVFDNPWPPLIHEFDKQDKEMVSSLVGYWVNLATTLNPNTGPASGLLNWPSYNPSSERIMNMRVPLQVDTGYLDNVCPFWDRVTVYPDGPNKSVVM